MRAEILISARLLLETLGPQAITLKAVAVQAGVTHGNVTYHFGTVEALQQALITAIIQDLTTATTQAVDHLRRGEMSPRDVVDVVFDAFATGGAGRLTAWLVATGAGHHLAPLYGIIATLVAELAVGEAGRKAGGRESIGLMMALIVVPALGDALIGQGLADSLELEADAVRQGAAAGLEHLRNKRQRFPAE